MSTYLETLQLYYEEEIEGEAYFRRLAGRFPTPDHERKLQLLADVERHAAAGVAPLISKYDLKPRGREALVASGRAEADAAVLDWMALINEMQGSYPAYLCAFEALEEMGPLEDRVRLSFLTEHEVAAIKFLELETTRPALSTGPLETYLKTSPEAWCAAVA